MNCFYTRKFDWTMYYNPIHSKNNNFTLLTIYWIIMWFVKALIITNDILLYSAASASMPEKTEVHQDTGKTHTLWHASKYVALFIGVHMISNKQG